jgi:hypothetical protein
MNRIARAVLLAILPSALASGQSSRDGGAATGAVAGATTQTAEEEVIAAVRGRLEARKRNDAEAWARYVDDGALDPFEGAVSWKQAKLKEIESWPRDVRYYYGPLEDIKVRVHGSTAVVAFRARQYNDIGGQVTYQQTWQIETHIRRGKDWLLVSVADAPIAFDPVVAKIDPGVYDAYVGTYQWSPTLRSTITREGDRLFEQFTGEGKVEWLPENESTFFVKGSGADKFIFVKDRNGRVTHYIDRAFGSTDRIVGRIQ